MGTTLQHGIFLPAEGERNCYAGLASNWTILDGTIGGYSSHAANLTIHVTAADKEAWNGKADASALTAHTGDATIHVTAEDKAKWDAVTGKADDASVMHLTGDESSTGKKVFGDMATFDGSYLGNEASTNARTDLVLESNQDTHGQSGIYITKFRQNKAQGSMSGNDVVYIALDVLENSVRTNQALRASFTQFVNDLPTRVIFYSNVIGDRFLGTAANKWTHINGLNPGALSLPDLSAGVDISGYFTIGTTENAYTPTVNGWVCIRGTAASGSAGIYVENSKGFYASANSMIVYAGTDRCVNLCFPVISGESYNIVLKGVNTSINAKFFPCMGNV